MTKRSPITYEEALRDNAPPEARWKDSGIPPRFMGCSFETYDATTDDQRRALAIAKHYAYTFHDAMQHGSCLLMIGRTGTGKTHLACTIAKHVMARNCSVRFDTVQRAIRTIKDTWSTKASQAEALKVYTRPDLLILDEVGTQFGSDAERLVLFDILGERYDFMRPTVLISNLPKADVAQMIGDRILDRMREGGGQQIVFDWDSHRATPRTEETK